MNPPSAINVYPWQAEQWQRLTDASRQDRLSHALLFSGRLGTGLTDFADRFAKFLLCESAADSNACGNCRSCALIDAGNHPDLRKVNPLDVGKQIGVDQIRELSEFYSLTGHYGRHKVSIVDPAEAMNRAAANALLKTLEEPPQGAVLILLSSRFDATPMTIRSRCQRIGFENVDQQLAAEWLAGEIAEPAAAAAYLAAEMGAPLAAAELFHADGIERRRQISAAWLAISEGTDSPFNVAKNLGEIPIGEQIGHLSQLVYEFVVGKYGAEPYYGSALAPPGPGQESNLHALGDRINLSDLYEFLDLLFEAKALLLNNANVREIDLADRLWLRLAEANRSEPTRSPRSS